MHVKVQCQKNKIKLHYMHFFSKYRLDVFVYRTCANAMVFGYVLWRQLYKKRMLSNKLSERDMFINV